MGNNQLEKVYIIRDFTGQYHLAANFAIRTYCDQALLPDDEISPLHIRSFEKMHDIAEHFCRDCHYLLCEELDRIFNPK